VVCYAAAEPLKLNSYRSLFSNNGFRSICAAYDLALRRPRHDADLGPSSGACTAGRQQIPSQEPTLQHAAKRKDPRQISVGSERMSRPVNFGARQIPRLEPMLERT
jgi:hypothetical protein